MSQWAANWWGNWLLTFGGLSPTIFKRWLEVCEFKVFLDGEKVFVDAIYAKSSGGNIKLKNILGETKELKNCQISEVNVTSEMLILTSIKTSS